MMKMHFTLSPALGQTILADLRKHFPLPDHGCIAGGAILDWMEGRIPNDIDVFVRSGRLTPQFELNRTADNGILRRLDDAYFGQRIYWRSTYQVLATERDGLLNRIEVAGTDRAAAIITGFDLNACRAAIDLRTGRLVWDRSFERFVETRELQVTGLNTPPHTMLRYLSKKERLECRGDDDREMEILAAACLPFPDPWDEESDDARDAPILRFGEKMVAVHDRHARRISTYADLEKLPLFWGLRTRGEIGEDFREHPILQRGGCANTLRFAGARVLRDLRTRPARSSVACGGLPLQHALLADRQPLQADAYFEGPAVDPKAAGRVLDCFEREAGLEEVLHLSSLGEQERAIRISEAQRSIRGDWIYRAIADWGVPADLESADSADSFLRAFEEELTPGVLTLPSRVLGLRVGEVTTTAGLLQEGEAWPSIDSKVARLKDGRLRVVALRTAGDCSPPVVVFLHRGEHGYAIEYVRSDPGRGPGWRALSAAGWILAGLNGTSKRAALRQTFRAWLAWRYGSPTPVSAALAKLLVPERVTSGDALRGIRRAIALFCARSAPRPLAGAVELRLTQIGLEPF
jgi:hypothetical protein